MCVCVCNIPLARLTKQLVNFVATDVSIGMKLPEYLLCYPGERETVRQ